MSPTCRNGPEGARANWTYPLLSCRATVNYSSRTAKLNDWEDEMRRHMITTLATFVGLSAANAADVFDMPQGQHQP